MESLLMLLAQVLIRQFQIVLTLGEITSISRNRPMSSLAELVLELAAEVDSCNTLIMD